MPFLSTVSQPPASPIQFAFEVRLVTADLLPTLDSKITKKHYFYPFYNVLGSKLKLEIQDILSCNNNNEHQLQIFGLPL